MGRTTPLRRAIKRTFIPYLTAKGFVCDMRDAPGVFTFRKIDSDALYVCDVQWEKYGHPRFVVNFGKCSLEGVTFRGRRVLPGDVCPGDTPDCGRLYGSPRSSWGTGDWFRQDRPLPRIVSFSKLYTPDVVVAKLMTLFAEVEDYWNSGRVGQHLRLPSVTPYYAAELQETQRRGRDWSFLLFLVRFAASVGVWYALFRLVWEFHVAIYPDHQLAQFWREGIGFRSFVLSSLMVFSLLPGAIVAGSTVFGVLLWLLSPPRQKPDYVTYSLRSMRRYFVFGIPGLVLALAAASLLQSLQ